MVLPHLRGRYAMPLHQLQYQHVQQQEHGLLEQAAEEDTDQDAGQNRKAVPV